MAAKGGRSLMERFEATTSSPIEGKIIKATDSTIDVPKLKHLEAILLFTHLPDFSMGKIAEGLLSRSREQSWVVVLKTLIIFHRLMRDGHERFSQYLVTSATGLQLETFVDASSPDALAMSGFVRAYAGYLNTKITIYRQLGFEVCHVKARENISRIEATTLPDVIKSLRMFMGMCDKLLVAVSEESPAAAVQMESQGHGAFAVQVKMPPAHLFANNCIKGAVRLLLKDALRLFVYMNDDVVKILETYFTLQKREASEALGAYEEFVRICTKLDAFFSKAKSAGLVEERHVPELTSAPKVLLPAMHDYVDNYGRKRSLEDEARVQEQMDRLHFEGEDLHDESTT
eukprot:m.228145 g.228145  ORF g.228145 m.228145 type:complete len:344 (-) comp17411_c0_seq1:59-1090(-)